jgi:beta-phosphoglucomutase-like phosphatase (HAD superfamily)
MSAEFLVLFDLDGTLLLDDAYTHGRAMVRAMRDVYGVSLRDGMSTPSIPGARQIVGSHAMPCARRAWTTTQSIEK